MDIPIYNCLISDENDETGICAISFVDCPANEVDFVRLAKQSHEVHLDRNTHKQILTGVVLKPDQLIYRHNEQLGEHYIRFSAAEIEKISHRMMRTGVALHNTTHQHQTPLDGNYLTELWIVADPENDKSRALGFENLPKGTLMCSYKVEDPNYWTNEVMTGHVKGFSLEGFFNQQPCNLNINQSEQKCKKMNKPRKKTLLGRIAKMLLDIETVQKSDATASGEPFVVFVLSDGKEIYVDQDGFATLDDEQAPAGEHKLANGNILVVDEQGNFVDTHEASTAKAVPNQKTAPETLRRMRTRQRLASFEPKTAEALKAKIAEMQATIDELSAALDEAQSMLDGKEQQVEELRRKTPSVRPALQCTAMLQNSKDLSPAERMAVVLNQNMAAKRR